MTRTGYRICEEAYFERGYVDERLHWPYSSARNYAGRPGLVEVITDWRPAVRRRVRCASETEFQRGRSQSEFGNEIKSPPLSIVSIKTDAS